MSETIIEDSSTVPQSVHTASALDGSTSISVEPQQSHFKPFLLFVPLESFEPTFESVGFITDIIITVHLYVKFHKLFVLSSSIININSFCLFF